MHLKLITQIVKYSTASIGGVSLLYSFNKNKIKTAYNSDFRISSFSGSSAWDFNWDHRDPSSLVKPLKENPTKDQQEDYNKKLEKHKSKAVRHILLIRHGQYVYGDSDKERFLTELGRQQATFTGKRLNEIGLSLDKVVVSTMTRAQETANLILKQLSKGDAIKRKDCGMLEEGAVFKPIPEIDYWNPDESEFFIDNARIEAAFRKYIHRAEPSQEKDSHTMLVCHGNVIRYFVCRALQLPPEAWLRFNIHHASVTWLVLYPNGRVVVKFFGDCGWMPPKHVTLS